MKVELNEIEETKKEVKYPYIGKNEQTGLIVLFTTNNTGVVLNKDKCWREGHFSDCWDESCFEYFKGSVILSND